MKTRTIPILILSLAALTALAALAALALGAGTVVSAQSSSSYNLRWWSVDGGGGALSSGGAYRLDGSIGQPDAGSLAGGYYTLSGGFWGGVKPRYPLYLPLIFQR